MKFFCRKKTLSTALGFEPRSFDCYWNFYTFLKLFILFSASDSDVLQQVQTVEKNGTRLKLPSQKVLQSISVEEQEQESREVDSKIKVWQDV